MWRDSSGERAFTSIRRRRKSRRGFCGKRRSPQQPRKTRNFRTKQRVRASGRITEFCYNDGFGAVPKRPKGEVCKTSIRGFESHPRLQASRFKSMDYNFRLFPGIPDLGTFGNNWEKSLFQTLDCTPMCIRNQMSVEVQRGLDRSVPQLLLRDLGGYADVVQDRSMNVTQLMPRHALKPCCLCRRPQHAFQKITLAVRSARLVREE